MMWYILTSNHELFGAFKFKIDARRYAEERLGLYTCWIRQLNRVDFNGR